VRLCWSIGNRLGHRIVLVPNDVAPQVPAVGLEGEGDAPRDAVQILLLHADRQRSVAAREHPVGSAPDFLAVGSACLGPDASVGVAQVEPERPVVAKDAANFPKHVNHRGDVLVYRWLEADLPADAVVPQGKVRRARHDAMHRLGGELGQHGAGVALVDGEPRVLPSRRHGHLAIEAAIFDCAVRGGA
jgi:hypothetical protein